MSDPNYVACVYEARTRTWQANCQSSEVWCKTHGWDCPKQGDTMREHNTKWAGTGIPPAFQEPKHLLIDSQLGSLSLTPDEYEAYISEEKALFQKYQAIQQQREKRK